MVPISAHNLCLLGGAMESNLEHIGQYGLTYISLMANQYMDQANCTLFQYEHTAL